MAATPKPVRIRHKAAENKMRHAVKEHLPHAAKSIMKDNKKAHKKAKSKFKELGGKY